VRCTAICPGFIKTDMTARMPSDVLKFVVARTKVKRAGEPWEVGQAVVRAAAAYGNTYSPCAVVLVAGGMELGGGRRCTSRKSVRTSCATSSSASITGTAAAGQLSFGLRQEWLYGRTGRLSPAALDAADRPVGEHLVELFDGLLVGTAVQVPQFVPDDWGGHMEKGRRDVR